MEFSLLVQDSDEFVFIEFSFDGSDETSSYLIAWNIQNVLVDVGSHGQRTCLQVSLRFCF